MCDTAWFELYLENNPKDRKRRDLIVKHAEAQGGDTEAFLRRLFPRYWRMVEMSPPGTAGSSIGLTPQREREILVAMIRKVGPALKASPEHGQGKERQLPDHVPHIG